MRRGHQVEKWKSVHLRLFERETTLKELRLPSRKRRFFQTSCATAHVTLIDKPGFHPHN